MGLAIACKDGVPFSYISIELYMSPTIFDTFPGELNTLKTRIAQSEHNISPIATVEGVAN